MLSVSQLANRFHISRTTILYYERAGLLLPCSRSENGYRWYGNKETNRLESILAYRSFGVPVLTIASLLDNKDDHTREQILHDQFNSLEREIQSLRQQQKAIVTLLEQPELLRQNIVNKKRWGAIMRSAGLKEQDMKNWHRQFEKMEPDGHQEFLESLQIDSNEIKEIRAWSKS